LGEHRSEERARSAAAEPWSVVRLERASRRGTSEERSGRTCMSVLREREDVPVTVDWAGLRAAAVEAMGQAYAPYSNFPVGVAGLVDDGRVVVGCNVENASYGIGLCAECGLVSSLHATGGGRLVAISCVDANGEPLMPCGRCRQLLWEHGGPDCLVEAVPRPLRVAELLPHAF